MESSRDKVIEKEKLMAMKYGIILSQNKELIIKLKKRKQENDELKQKLQEYKKKETNNELSLNDYYNKRMNNTLHKRDDSVPLAKRVVPTSYSTSSFFTNYNGGEVEANDRHIENSKINDKSSDSDPNYLLRKCQKANGEEEGLSSKNDFELRSSHSNIGQFNIQDALSVFTPDQRELIKLIMNKLISDKKPRSESDEHNPSTLVEMQSNESK